MTKPMPATAKSNSERQRAFADKQRTSGLKKISLWVDDAEERIIKAHLIKTRPSMALPDLVGSEKQIIWANQLRKTAINLIYANEKETTRLIKNITSDLDTQQQILSHLHSKTWASYWIDSRHYSTGSLLKLIYDEIKEKPIGSLTKLSSEVNAAKEEILKNALLLPDGNRGNLSIDMRLKDHCIILKPESFNEKFNEVAKFLGFGYEQKDWEKEIHKEFDLKNSAAHIAAQLLEKNYSVRIMDDAIRDLVIANTYTPDPTRILTSNKNIKTDKPEFLLSIICGDSPDLSYLEKLPGVHVSKSGKSVFIAAKHYETVIDFCQHNGVFMTNAAQEIVSLGELECTFGVKVKREPAKKFKTEKPKRKEVTHVIDPQFADD